MSMTQAALAGADAGPLGVAIGAVVGAMLNAQKHATWEFCECCNRETPHLDNCCVYDGMPNRDTCALYLQRFRQFRTHPNIEYRPYDDRYVRTV